MSPKVSVIVPCYNAAAFIRDTIESVLGQTFGDFELIVLNDGSCDDSEKIVREFSDPRVKLVSKPNSGVADTRNQGVRLARGSYIAFLDADDLFCEANLEKKVEFLESHPDCGLVHSDVFLFDAAGSHRKNAGAACQGAALNPILEFKAMVNSPSSAVVRKELLEKVGGFDTRLSTSADRDLWIRLAAETRFGFIDAPLIKYRLHAGQMSRNIDAMERDLELLYDKLRGGAFFAGRGHYHHCRAIVEKVIAASYFRHTWKLHKFLKHLGRAGFHFLMQFPARARNGGGCS